MTVKKMSVNVAKASKKSRLPVSSLLPRIAIYSAVVAGIMASFYDFRLGTLSIFSGREFSEAKQYIASINRGQQAYYAEYGQFSDSIAKLGLGIKEQADNHNYTIGSSMGPVQTLQNQREPAQFESAIAIAKPNDMSIGKSYTGAVFAFKEKGSDMITTIAAICESNGVNATYAETWSPPTFDGKEIHCQPGTTKLR
ncbi:type IV pilin-like G/H family protein [Microcoleus vaginatus]|uniref:type IV pilin-like G/H family protein n=1 Tax=Microcoleus vaginatus TaxID=119532 RepID=UPI0016843704|nr:type IV pilin-like G/H family protein [Microcoleus sp. FACHB-84]MBD2010031.1 type IV pilin-like G/H family protein [Microcoleus sp. FACHB-45]